MPVRNLVSWTSIVAGYAWNGHGQKSTEMFRAMELQGEIPDEISFVNVLTGCSHGGLLRRGWVYFQSMQRDYSLSPGKEHYCCLLDLLARSGRLDEAEDLLASMPFAPDEVACKTVLAACGIYRDLERAIRVADVVLDDHAGSSDCYLLLRNIFCEV
ncbi:hypothetical protein SELMODRAFT_129287 [Selaginella moellendorffii]|uniref:Pentacotripeptide-repeat region of PRORP domain-containing protein n=2 Tax=Selaginella moellendorffii TaxID=88036 RepID=D8T0Q3_SELML|nr:hypothetical protein SELMODRAFT_129287 [Selaginella moellendorffii]